MTISRIFLWQTSAVDWCESNFEITHLIAEFYNTISNVLFFVFPPLLIHLFKQYAVQVTWGVNVVWLLLLVVGIGSVYFHATLSMLGQLLDEIAIIWVIMCALALWFPRRLMPLVLQQDRLRFRRVILVAAVLSSALACVMPAINALVLMVCGIPATALLASQLRRCEEPRVYRLGVRCFVVWILAITSWVSDKVFCSLWQALSFPYLHGAWHVLVFVASYTACVLFAYFDAKDEVPEQMPVMRYWPRDSWNFFGIPYVTLKCGGTPPTHKNT